MSCPKCGRVKAKKLNDQVRRVIDGVLLTWQRVKCSHCGQVWVKRNKTSAKEQ